MGPPTHEICYSANPGPAIPGSCGRDSARAAGAPTRRASGSAATAGRGSPGRVRPAARSTARKRFCGDCGGRRSPAPTDLRPPGRGRGAGRGPPARSRSGGSSRSCSPTSSASRPSPRTATPRRCARLLTRYFELAREVIEPLRRHGREVHRRRRDGRLGRADRPRGRRRARRPRRPRAGRRGPRRSAPGIQARAGVLTGEAAVTIGATNQGMVAGDLVNTAAGSSRSRRPAPCSSARRRMRAAERAIAFEPAGEQVLKGKAAPVPAWRALRVVAERGGARPRATRSRRRSSAATTSCACSRTCSTRPAASAGRGSCRSSGRPASARAASPGSSRSTSTASSSDVYWHEGRSPAYGEGITFWALGEMVRGAGRPAPRATTRRRRGRGSPATVAEHVPDEAERALDRAARCWRCSGSSDAPIGGRRSCSRPGGRSSSGSPRRAPVVLVFEDLQWADTGPARLHRPPARVEPRTCPIFVVTLARPELLERRPDWGAGKRNFTSHRTSSRCPSDAMRELLAGLVPGPARAGRRARSSPAPTASRCTRSRPSGCCWPRAGSCCEGDGYAPVGRPRRRWRCPRRCTR